MAKAKSSPFVLSNTVQLSAVNTTGTATIDLGSYVDVSSKTGIAVHAVDCVFQVYDSSSNAIDAPEGLNGDAFWVSAQVFDQTRDALQIANDNSLIGSATLEYNGGYLTSMENDVYPDSYPTPGRLSISPQLTLVARAAGSAFASNKNLYVTFRI